MSQQTISGHRGAWRALKVSTSTLDGTHSRDTSRRRCTGLPIYRFRDAIFLLISLYLRIGKSVNRYMCERG